MTNNSDLRDTHSAGWRAVARVVCLGLVALSLAAVAPVGATVTQGATPVPRPVRDIWPGPESSHPASLTNARGTLYFSAHDPVHGRELWKSDGTRAGTVRVKDIVPGAQGSYPQQFTVVGRAVYFTGSPGGKRPQSRLWKTNGTAKGTVLVKSGVKAIDLTNVAGTLFFSAKNTRTGRQGLWKSDGTTRGTVLVKDVWPRFGPLYLTTVGRTLFFSAAGSSGRELWKSDGTARGTVRVKDINPHGSSAPQELTVLGLTLFFTAGDGTSGRELWKSDGSARGTVMVEDILLGASSSPSSLTTVGATLCFTALDALRQPGLWKSDGTAQGTTLIKQIQVDSMVAFGGVLHFLAHEPGGLELWRSDGTPAGTVSVRTLGPGLWGGPMVVAGNTLYFTIVEDALSGPYDRNLWASDGSPSGTTVIMTVSGDVLRRWYTTPVGHDLFVNGWDEPQGLELWVVPPGPSIAISVNTSAIYLYDGSPNGTGPAFPATTVAAVLKNSPQKDLRLTATLVQDGVTMSWATGAKGAGYYDCSSWACDELLSIDMGFYGPTLHRGDATAHFLVEEANCISDCLVAEDTETVHIP